MKRFLILFVTLLTLPALAADPQRIAVLSAFAPELKAIREQMIPPKAKLKTTTINGTRFDEVEINGRHFIFGLSGISMINAAMCTQLVIDRFNVDAVVFSGIAGGINPELHPGDVIVPGKWIHQMESFWPNPDPMGPGKYTFPSWFEPKYGNYKGMFPADVDAVRGGMDKPQTMHTFPADPGMLSEATQAAKTVKITDLRGGTAKIVVGCAAMSGPVFLDNADFRVFAYETWHVDGHDMESTAVAQVAWANHIPVLIIRGLSDLAGEQAGPNEERAYLEIAAKNAAIVTSRILLGMPKAGK